MGHKKHAPRGTPNQRGEKGPRLEIVLKCDSIGSQEAVLSSLSEKGDTDVDLSVSYAGVGAITKSDVLLALTASRLIVGFGVSVMPKVKQLCLEKHVEVRLYDVIYHLTEDLARIAEALVPSEPQEKITGQAEIIKLFKSSRGGIILGCKVLQGTVSKGKAFRVISAMGPIYSGKVESLHIEKDAVEQAKKGQNVGIKISNFNRAKLGDLVECFEIVRPGSKQTWRPRAGVFIPKA
jgi:translation initiation factor IF-2